MAGTFEKVGDKYKITAGSYIAPSQTLTEGDLISRPRFNLNVSTENVYNSVRPTTRNQENGYAATPAEEVKYEIVYNITNVSNGIFTATNSLKNGDRVRFQNWTGTTYDNSKLPVGIIENFYYYVVNATPTSFRVSLSKGGVPLVVSTNAQSSTLRVFHDFYLTKDNERKIVDVSYPYVSDINLSRRLSIIDLKNSRQELSGQIKTKIGTPFVTPFDFTVGSVFRYIDKHKRFFEEIDGVSHTGTINNSFVNDNDNTLSLGDSIIFTKCRSRTRRDYKLMFRIMFVL
jgi:hypothetical protein